MLTEEANLKIKQTQPLATLTVRKAIWARENIKPSFQARSLTKLLTHKFQLINEAQYSEVQRTQQLPWHLLEELVVGFKINNKGVWK